MQLKFLLLLPSVDNSFVRLLLLGQHSSRDDSVGSVPVSLYMVPVPRVGRQPGLQCTAMLLLAQYSQRSCFSEVSRCIFYLLNKRERKEMLIITLRAGKEDDPPATKCQNSWKGVIVQSYGSGTIPGLFWNCYKRRSLKKCEVFNYCENSLVCSHTLPPAVAEGAVG